MHGCAGCWIGAGGGWIETDVRLRGAMTRAHDGRHQGDEWAVGAELGGVGIETPHEGGGDE